MRTCLLVALLAAALSVCRATGSAGAVDCRAVAKAAIQYREFYKQIHSEEQVKTTIKNGIVYTGLNIDQDEEVEEIFCAILESEPVTAAALHRSSQGVLSDVKQLGLLHSVIIGVLLEEIVYGKKQVVSLEGQKKFVDATGFPNFPLALDKSALSKILSEVDTDSLGNLFHWYTDYNNNGSVETFSFNREQMVADMADAASLSEFVINARTYYTRDGWYPDVVSDDIEVVYDMENLLQVTQSMSEELKTAAEKYLHAERFYRVLHDAGFVNMVRGGPALYTCDFIVDNVLEALGYVVDLFGRETVQDVMTSHLHLEFSVDDTCALRSLICAVVSSKSQPELMKLIPQQVLREGSIHGVLYWNGVIQIQLALLKPEQQWLGEITLYLRLAKMAEAVGFPSFPLSISTAQAKQMAATVKSRRYNNDDLDELAQGIKDANSLTDLFFAHWMFRNLEPFMGQTAEKIAIAEKLILSVYLLATSLEEYGLLMLPET